MSDSVEFDTDEVALRVAEKVSNRCGRKVDFTKVYQGEDGMPVRYIYVDGQRAKLTGPVTADPNSDDVEDAFIYSIAEQIRKQYQ